MDLGANTHINPALIELQVDGNLFLDIGNLLLSDQHEHDDITVHFRRGTNSTA